MNEMSQKIIIEVAEPKMPSDNPAVHGMPKKSTQASGLVVDDRVSVDNYTLNLRNPFKGTIRPELLDNGQILLAHETLEPLAVAVDLPDQVHETETMGAVVHAGALKPVYIPNLPRPVVSDIKDIVVKIEYTDLCGSNVNSLAVPNGYAKDGNSVLGHSFVGKIVEMGEGVAGFAIGDQVVGNFELSCGACRECKVEHYSNCLETNPSPLMPKLLCTTRAAAELGGPVLLGGKQGTFAEYIRIPYAGNNINKVPEGLPIEIASLFSCNISTAFHTVKMSQAKESDVVYIGGAGMIGSLIAQWLIEWKGVKKIVVADPVQFRLDLLTAKYPEQIVGLNVIDIGAENMVDALLAEHPVGYDISIDATGFRYPDAKDSQIKWKLGEFVDQTDVINKCILVSKVRGKVIVVSENRGNSDQIMTGAAFNKALSIMFTGQTPVQKYIAKLMQMVAENMDKYDPSFLITHTVSLEELPKMMLESFYKEQYEVQKVMVKVSSDEE